MFDCLFDPDRAGELKKIVFSEIQKLITDGPTPEHLDKAVNNVLKNREESKMHNNYWLNTLYTYYFSGINYDDPGNYEDILKGFTPSDISRVASELFGKSDLADIVFKPAVKE
ncbi:MAG: hypothetical protein R2744_05400 [Bacteroidales bacterium]